MKVLYVASEAYPYAMSGGLADVAGALPKALRQRLVGCRVVLPLYDTIPDELREDMKFITSITVPVAWRRQYCGIFEAHYGGVIYYLLDNQYYFKRGSLYGHYDDAERFAFFSRAVIEMLPYISYYPDIIHCNDWQSALVPVYLDCFYRDRDPFKFIRTVFTIHNIAYQGNYGTELISDVLGIPDDKAHIVMYNGDVNYMKGAIECANMITTVSRTYAEEILDPWFSYGLDGILRDRQFKLCGIVNGIDQDVYNPETDPLIYENYSADHPEKKAENKLMIQRHYGLPQRADVPVIGIVSRLATHKGFDLIKDMLDNFINTHDVQFIIIGSGEYEYETFFHMITENHPDKVGYNIGFHPHLAHKIYAGSDIFLMPSKSEPCGLAQMVALRYGSIPVVRETGGLKDTITDSGDNEGNGFTFKNYDAGDMEYALCRALEGYKNKLGWKQLVSRSMHYDSSWAKSASEYIKMYKNLLKRDI